MRTLIIADVHGNLPALEAVLASPQARSCQRIISLGDQVNFGPQPREVIQRLKELHTVMLLGNHEHRLLRASDAEFSGYNWNLQRWTAGQLEGVDLDFPTDLREGEIWYTHGTPGDPFHLIGEVEVPVQLDRLPQGVKYLFSGHNHRPWLVEHQGRTACNPGSLGMLEDNTGAVAPFVVMDDAGGRITLSRHTVPYDTAALARAYITTGCAASAPEMTRVVLHTMITGEYQGTLKLVRFVSSLGDLGDAEAWRLADAAWPWKEPLSTQAYWQRLKEELT